MGTLSLCHLCMVHVHDAVDTFTGMYKQVKIAGEAGRTRGVSLVGARGAHCRPSQEKQVSMQPPLPPSSHRMRTCTAFALSFRGKYVLLYQGYSRLCLRKLHQFRCYEAN